MKQMFSRNVPTLSEQEQESLGGKRVAVIGCGGLGGYVIEYLVRAGVGAVTAVDGDCFEDTNLNRQLLSLSGTLGENKAYVARKRALQINPDMDFNAVSRFLSEENADEILRGADIVVDALDNAKARLLLESECEKRGVTLVHGAVSGWNAQVCVVRPGSGILSRIYSLHGETQNESCLGAAAALCAGVQVCECVKLLCGRQSAADGRLLVIDLTNMEITAVKI